MARSATAGPIEDAKKEYCVSRGKIKGGPRWRNAPEWSGALGLVLAHRNHASEWEHPAFNT